MRRGFTLVEVMVALLLTSIVALLAQGILATVLDGATALKRATPPNDGPELGRIWLLEACRGVEVGVPGAGGFEGEGTSARFKTRLITSAGWTERQDASLEVRGAQVLLHTASLTLRVVDSVEAPALDYLVDGRADGGWVTGWSSPVSAPLAIRLRWVRGDLPDTLLCPIGGRG